MVSITSQIFNMSDQVQMWTSPAGSVERKSYDVDESMSAVIAPPGASSVTLQFTSFDTEEEYDFVTIKSCIAIDCLQSIELGQYSGSMIPDSVTSGTGILLIQWETDASVIAPGWSADWSSESVLEGGCLVHRADWRFLKY